MITKISLILISVLFVFTSCKTNNSKSSNNVQKVSEQKQLEPVYLISDSTKTNVVLGVKSLGRAKQGEVLRGGFSIKNNTKKSIVILSITASCGCMNVEYSKQPILQGDFKNFTLTYDSKDKNGQQFSQITITTSNGLYIIELDLFVD